MKQFKEIFFWSIGAVFVLVLLTALAIGGRFGNLFIKPYELSLERKVYKSSRQYNEPREELVYQLKEDLAGVRVQISKQRADGGSQTVIQSLENQADALEARINRIQSQIQ